MCNWYHFYLCSIILYDFHWFSFLTFNRRRFKLGIRLMCKAISPKNATKASVGTFGSSEKKTASPLSPTNNKSNNNNSPSTPIVKSQPRRRTVTLQELEKIQTLVGFCKCDKKTKCASSYCRKVKWITSCFVNYEKNKWNTTCQPALHGIRGRRPCIGRRPLRHSRTRIARLLFLVLAVHQRDVPLLRCLARVLARDCVSGDRWVGAWEGGRTVPVPCPV